MRLIDADALLESEIERYGCVPAVCTTTINGEYLDDVLDRQPTIDAEPVRHGKWIEVVVAETDTSRLINWECSECAIVVDHNTDNYCPNCGARMDGE